MLSYWPPAQVDGGINLTRPGSGRAKFSSSRRVGRMVGHRRAGRADGRVGVSSSGAGRADGGAQPGGSGGWRVKVSSSRLASRMANWMANWMANYIPPSTDGRPARPLPGVRWMVYVSSLSELSGSLSLSSPLQIRDIAQLAFFLFMRVTRASML